MARVVQRDVMRRLYLEHALCAALVTISCGGSNSTPPTNAETAHGVQGPVAASAPSGCQPHIELHGAAHWARELAQPEQQVLATHRIDLWQTYEPRGPKVGEMLVGSRALILEESVEAYRVRSPLDSSIGWVGKIQVARTLHQHTETRESCVP